jgi:hypothetical protein
MSVLSLGGSILTPSLGSNNEVDELSQRTSAGFPTVRDGILNVPQSLVLVGIVLWESALPSQCIGLLHQSNLVVLLTLPFDWSIVRGKRQARWPMVPYVIARV